MQILTQAVIVVACSGQVSAHVPTAIDPVDPERRDARRVLGRQLAAAFLCSRRAANGSERGPSREGSGTL